MKLAILFGIFAVGLLVISCGGNTSEKGTGDAPELTQQDIQDSGLEELEGVDDVLAELDDIDAELNIDAELEGLDDELNFE